MRLDTLTDPIGDPTCDRLGLFLRVVEGFDRGRRAVDNRNRAAAVFGIAIDIGDPERSRAASCSSSRADSPCRCRSPPPRHPSATIAFL
ncbi:MAG: hypothetical protein WA459_20720 [Stellaceae bacterium]